jgi:hypothetical protein
VQKTADLENCREPPIGPVRWSAVPRGRLLVEKAIEVLTRGVAEKWPVEGLGVALRVAVIGLDSDLVADGQGQTAGGCWSEGRMTDAR